MGNNPCPNNQDITCHLYGKDDFSSQAEAYTPFCYPSGITADMILKYKQNKSSTPAMNYFKGGDDGPMIQPRIKQNE